MTNRALTLLCFLLLSGCGGRAAHPVAVNNDYVAYEMVQPGIVIEINCLDLITESARGGPVNRMVLKWDKKRQAATTPVRRGRRRTGKDWVRSAETRFFRRRDRQGQAATGKDRSFVLQRPHFR